MVDSLYSTRVNEPPNSPLTPDTGAGYLRIGELARRTGVSPELLRAWEQRYGLLQPTRSPGGFRLYSEADEARIRRVTRLIADGLSAAQAARQALTADRAQLAVETPLVDQLADQLR